MYKRQVQIIQITRYSLNYSLNTSYSLLNNKLIANGLGCYSNLYMCFLKRRTISTLAVGAFRIRCIELLETNHGALIIDLRVLD